MQWIMIHSLCPIFAKSCLRKHLGDVVSQATDKAKAIVHQGQEAVEGIKDGTVANSPNSMKVYTVYTWENHENPWALDVQLQCFIAGVYICTEYTLS